MISIFRRSLRSWPTWTKTAVNCSPGYLDRKHPRWREQSSGDDAEKTRGRDSRNTRMTEEEAYQILGLRLGASVEDVARAHRSLMKKLHPDQGGSTYLAARINEAKEVLLRGRP
jgi:DnaJ domain